MRLKTDTSIRRLARGMLFPGLAAAVGVDLPAPGADQEAISESESGRRKKSRINAVTGASRWLSFSRGEVPERVRGWFEKKAKVAALYAGGGNSSRRGAIRLGNPSGFGGGSGVGP